MANVSTIYALSSAPGRAGVAVIRVSGPAAQDVLAAMVRRPPAHGQAAFRTVRDPQTGAALDQALILYFAAPNSETGEDVAEFQVHGGRAVVNAVLGALGRFPGCRMAEPGEFARRAFSNGKLDLAQAEGLADLVDAETEAQRVQALAQSSGALSQLYEGWRTTLLEAMALVEAAIDFSDESDVSGRAMKMACESVSALAVDLARHLADGRRGEILRDGFRVALLGAPNAGKSSLLNALAQRDAAIVSEEAGTTRDVIEVRLDLAGYPVIVSDTAGLRQATGAVEREGIRRSLAEAERADLILWLVEPGGNAQPALGESLEESREVSRETAPLVLMVHTKTDLTTAPAQTPSQTGLSISVKTGSGLEGLITRITQVAADRLASRSSPPLTQARHRQALETCLAGLNAFMAGDAEEAELRAEDLRRAAYALGRITGRVDVEDVLGQIFGRFCIGK
ncbi:MAG: tRNA uridine-5-carboxymethylaminomethyl(34) synthesis GTPase MnmE [Hyphomicrobiaceae bacterium]